MNYIPSICPLCSQTFAKIRTSETFTLRCSCNGNIFTTYFVTFYLASFKIHDFSAVINNIKFHWLHNKLYIYRLVIQDDMPNLLTIKIKSIEDVFAPKEEDLINPQAYFDKYKYLIVFS